MVDLAFYNTMAREKQAFQPLDAKNVRVYCCGPTVYDFAHIGNARPAIVFDVLFRLLRHVYGETHVTYARNITDVDDKINLRAYERGISIRDLTDATLAQYHRDLADLHVLPPTVEPRATDHMREMAAIIEKLIANGHAYVAEEHVLFSVPSMPAYGALSRRPLDEMLNGARIDVAPYKRDPMDFVLWKPSREPHEPGWPSPAGIATPGRPGWHIECSAMSWKHLGEVFDIHAGGIDLVFPHHENEIAQTCCAFGHKVMANIWMHNGFLQVEGDKMSKSLGNFATIREVLENWEGRAWPGEVARLAMLRAHYRQPIDWTVKALEESWAALDEFYALTKDVAPTEIGSGVLAALGDDLNTPKAIAELHGLKNAKDFGALKASLTLLGFLNESADSWAARRVTAAGIDTAKVDALIKERLAARAAKNFAESDRIRDALAAMGVQLKDGKGADGAPITTWEVKA